MGQQYCYECDVLKEYYWLKVNRFLMAVKSMSVPTLGGSRKVSEEEIQILKDEALRALCNLISHWKACYGIALDGEMGSEDRAA